MRDRKWRARNAPLPRELAYIEETVDSDHDHHHHRSANFGSAFAIGITLNFAFVVAEFIYGHLANSLALVADAGHNLSDVLSLLIAWVAAILVKRRPTPNRTYGMQRSSILAALINAVILLLVLGATAWETIHRLSDPQPVVGVTVMWVAGLGIIINTVTAILFASGRKTDINIRGAFVHMAADAAISVGVVIAGAIILRTGWLLLDPIVSLGIVVIVFWGTWGLLRDSINLALDAVPAGSDRTAIEQFLCGLPKVVDVHDVHIWGMSTTETALTAHVVTSGPVQSNKFLVEAENALHHRFGIEHATLQLEIEDANNVIVCRCRLSR